MWYKKHMNSVTKEREREKKKKTRMVKDNGNALTLLCVGLTNFITSHNPFIS